MITNTEIKAAETVAQHTILELSGATDSASEKPRVGVERIRQLAGLVITLLSEVASLHSKARIRDKIFQTTLESNEWLREDAGASIHARDKARRQVNYLRKQVHGLNKRIDVLERALERKETEAAAVVKQ